MCGSAGLGEGLEGGGDLRYVGTVTFFSPSINLHNACALRLMRDVARIFFFFRTLIRMFVAGAFMLD